MTVKDSASICLAIRSSPIWFAVLQYDFRHWTFRMYYSNHSGALARYDINRPTKRPGGQCFACHSSNHYTVCTLCCHKLCLQCKVIAVGSRLGRRFKHFHRVYINTLLLTMTSIDQYMSPPGLIRLAQPFFGRYCWRLEEMQRA